MPLNSVFEQEACLCVVSHALHCTWLSTGSQCHLLVSGLKIVSLSVNLPKMAQGKDQSFASRLFHRCLKSNQELKGQENEVPHVSENTIIWDKLSKWGVVFALFCLCPSLRAQWLTSVLLLYLLI